MLIKVNQNFNKTLLGLPFPTGLTRFGSMLHFHIESSHLIFTVNSMTGFYMKCNTDE